MSTLVNRVANSGLVTIDLEHYYPKEDIVVFDIKDFLYMEMILKEKDFRQALKELDWSVYDGKRVIVTCSVDAIIPMWAYMLISTYLKDKATDVYEGDLNQYMAHYYTDLIDAMDVHTYQDKMLVIKGCGDKNIPSQVYLKLTHRLVGVAKSIMYGEPCSTVPIYKKPKA